MDFLAEMSRGPEKLSRKKGVVGTHKTKTFLTAPWHNVFRITILIVLFITATENTYEFVFGLCSCVITEITYWILHENKQEKK